MTVTSQPPELTWGALAIESASGPSDGSWWCEFLFEGSSFGNAAAIVEEIRSQLEDGSLLVRSGYGNREVVLRVRLGAVDGPSLAAAEAAFLAEVQAEQPAPLVYTPSAIDAEAGAFEVVSADVQREYGDLFDLREKSRLTRDFTVTLTCLPWVRALNLTEIPAIPAPEAPDTPATYAVIDPCDSASGWSALPCHTNHWGSRFVDSGTGTAGTWVRAYALNEVASGLGFLSAVRAGAVSLAGMPYLTVDLGTSSNPSTGGPAVKVQAIVAGASHDPAAVEPLAPGLDRYYFADLPDAFTGLEIRCFWNVATAATRRVVIYEIGRTDRIEVDGTNGFQIARTATVGGTVPTQAALTFDAGEDPLIGSTALIYTGGSPVVPMRALRTSSATVTTDTTMISGGRNTLASAMTFRVPVDRFTSGATYDLLARCSFTGSATVTWSAKVVDSAGATMPGSEVVASGTVLLTNTTTDPWKIHQIGAAQLPPVVIEGATTHLVEVSLSMASGGSGVQVDEAWLLDTDNGAVTVIHEPSTSQLSRVEIRSPRLDAPRHQVVGTWLTHGTQDITRLVTAPGRHRFPPGLLHVFTATDMAKYAECSLRYYERHGWHVFTPTSETA